MCDLIKDQGWAIIGNSGNRIGECFQKTARLHPKQMVHHRKQPFIMNYCPYFSCYGLATKTIEIRKNTSPSVFYTKYPLRKT